MEIDKKPYHTKQKMLDYLDTTIEMLEDQTKGVELEDFDNPRIQEQLNIHEKLSKVEVLRIVRDWVKKNL